MAKPFVKWVGGKSKIAKTIIDSFPKHFRNYYEPFVGGGAIYFNLKLFDKTSFLSDLNPELMITYKVLQQEPNLLIKQLELFQDNHSKENYQKIRAAPFSQDPIQVASRFIYLNKTCFNGLFRVNSHGRFNTPIGDKERPTICDKQNLFLVSECLKNAQIEYGHFSEIKPKKDDLVYCDPPYHGTYNQYIARNKFDEKSHRDLKTCADAWKKNGAYVVISNSNTPFVRDLFKNFKIIELQAPRTVSGKTSGRGDVQELLITSFDEV